MIDELLLQVLDQSHPVTLQIARLVCKDWQNIIIGSSKLRKRLFRVSDRCCYPFYTFDQSSRVFLMLTYHASSIDDVKTLIQCDQLIPKDRRKLIDLKLFVELLFHNWWFTSSIIVELIQMLHWLKSFINDSSLFINQINRLWDESLILMNQKSRDFYANDIKNFDSFLVQFHHSFGYYIKKKLSSDLILFAIKYDCPKFLDYLIDDCLITLPNFDKIIDAIIVDLDSQSLLNAKNIDLLVKFASVRYQIHPSQLVQRLSQLTLFRDLCIKRDDVCLTQKLIDLGIKWGTRDTIMLLSKYNIHGCYNMMHWCYRSGRLFSNLKNNPSERLWIKTFIKYQMHHIRRTGESDCYFLNQVFLSDPILFKLDQDDSVRIWSSIFELGCDPILIRWAQKNLHSLTNESIPRFCPIWIENVESFHALDQILDQNPGLKSITEIQVCKSIQHLVLPESELSVIDVIRSKDLNLFDRTLLSQLTNNQLTFGSFFTYLMMKCHSGDAKFLMNQLFPHLIDRFGSNPSLTKKMVLCCICLKETKFLDHLLVNDLYKFDASDLGFDTNNKFIKKNQLNHFVASEPIFMWFKHVAKVDPPKSYRELNCRNPDEFKKSIKKIYGFMPSND